MSGRKPHPLTDQMPDELREVLLDFWWDVDRLWQLPGADRQHWYQCLTVLTKGHAPW